MSDPSKPERSPDGAGSRGVVVTAAGPNMRSLLHQFALPTFQQFGNRWGYQVRARDLPRDGTAADEAAQHAKWAKLTVMREALAEFPLVLWLDADILLTRTDEDIADHLHPDHFQALALEHVPFEHRVNPNTGVWLMRSCPEALAFLDAVEAAGPQPGPWADQGAVLAALGWNRGDEVYRWAGPGVGSPFLAGTSWLPPGWNQPYLDGRTSENCYNSVPESYATRPSVPFPHAVHFMGMSWPARAEHMSRVAATVLRDSAERA
ncbi:hypothetical protein V6K52_03190 [Knoellia sp. S7-12]|uniref:hypothetical protein n=1 Tax=Knoellia sp. S7-12 TaxID=3126698 RepID=UPI0033668A8B